MESRAGPSTVARAGIPLSAASQARRRKPQSAPALSPPLPGHRGPLQAMQAPEAQSRAEHDTIQVHERDCSSDLVQLAAGTNEPSQGDGPAMGRRQWRRAAKLAKWHRRRAPGLTPTQEDDSPCRADPAGLATHDGQSRAAPAGNSNPGDLVRVIPTCRITAGPSSSCGSCKEMREQHDDLPHMVTLTEDGPGCPHSSASGFEPGLPLLPGLVYHIQDENAQQSNEGSQAPVCLKQSPWARLPGCTGTCQSLSIFLCSQCEAG